VARERGERIHFTAQCAREVKRVKSFFAAFATLAQEEELHPGLPG
jgi:hypothetical protein